MLERLVSHVISNLVAGLKWRATGAALLLFAAALMFMAATFAFLAFYLRLTNFTSPWIAALVVGATIAILAVVIALFGYLMIRHHRLDDLQFLDREFRGAIAQLTSGNTKPTEEQAMGLVAAAALAGLILGRRLSK